jgi:hypothetical protein
MELSEICYLILCKGLGIFLNDLRNPKEIIDDFFKRILGKNIRYVWNMNEYTDVCQRGLDETDEEESVSTMCCGRRARSKTRLNRSADDHRRREKVQAFPDEHAADIAFRHLLDCCLKPKARQAMLRRAERRVAKSVLAYERNLIKRKTLPQCASIRGDDHLAKAKKAYGAGLRAAEKTLAYWELRDGERKALDTSSQVLYDIISATCALNESLIADGVDRSLKAGLEALNDEENGDESAMREAVEIKLERILNRAADMLRKNGADNSFFSMTKEEFRKHFRLTISCGEDLRNTLNEIMTAARKGAESAVGKDSVNLNPTIREALEKLLRQLEDRARNAMKDPERVGRHCLNFLKFETTSIFKKTLSINSTVASGEGWTKIQREIGIRLRNLRDIQEVIVSRSREGFKPLFWGLKKWETDEARWQGSGANVNTNELATKLPELGGKAKTTGAVNYKGFDALFCEALRVHNRWLTTTHFCEIIKDKTGQKIKASESAYPEDDGLRNQTTEDLPDPASHKFDDDLDRIHRIDRLIRKQDKKLREFWNAVRRNRDNYEMALQELREAGWSDSKISRIKNDFLKLLPKEGLREK